MRKMLKKLESIIECEDVESEVPFNFLRHFIRTSPDKSVCFCGLIKSEKRSATKGKRHNNYCCLYSLYKLCLRLMSLQNMRRLDSGLTYKTNIASEVYTHHFTIHRSFKAKPSKGCWPMLT